MSQPTLITLEGIVMPKEGGGELGNLKSTSKLWPQFSDLGKTYATEREKLSKCATTVFLGVLLSLPQKSYAIYVPILSTSLSTKLGR